MLVQCSAIELLGGVRDGAASLMISIKSIMDFNYPLPPKRYGGEGHPRFLNESHGL